jgi:hypothetical protein
MPRKAKGKRPTYFDDPDNDKLLAILMALAGEVSVLHDRLDTVERIARMRGVLVDGEVDGYVPSAEVAEQRDAWRAEFLDRLLRIVRQEGESVARNESEQGYAQTIAAVST